MYSELVLGPPGTGKTRYLLDRVEEYLKIGTHPEDIGFISFTKKAVNEAKDRAVAAFKINIKKFQYFRTLHSFAFRQLGLSTGHIMGYHNYRDFSDLVGMKVTGHKVNDEYVYEMTKGDQLLFMDSYSRLTCKSLEEAREVLNVEIDPFELEYFIDSYNKYKEVNGLYDFTDILQKFMKGGISPKLKVLFVDEAQDLCKLQWQMVEKLTKSAESTVIAGDDDQAIFRWSGADVDYFINLAKHEKTFVLNKSYRLPQTIQLYSQKVINSVKYRNKKPFGPRDFGGNISFVNALEDLPLGQGQWLILTRNNSFINEIVQHVRQAGYSYSTAHWSTDKSAALKAAVTWEELLKGFNVRRSRIINCLAFTSQWDDDKADLIPDETTLDELKRLVNLTASNIWHQALDKMPVEDREYFIAARRQGEQLMKPPRIKISTIHGAKGGEAQNVVLFTDVSLRTYESMIKNESNYEDETRVFYVGITRALENLYIMQPQTSTFFALSGELN